MLDIRLIREDAEGIAAKLRTKVPETTLDAVLALDAEMREKKTRVENLKAERNDVSKQIGELKREGQDATAVMEKVSVFAEEIHQLDRDVSELEQRFSDELSRHPNIPMDDIKVSLDPKDNVVIKEFGELPVFDFVPKNHVELNEGLGIFDFARGAKVAGAGWPAYRGMGARLEWALLQYMIDYHVKNGFTHWFPPLLVKEDMMFAVGQLPKFADQVYKTTKECDNLYLIPTAEVSLNAMHYDEILEEEQLPIRYCAYTPCFRREAGAAGSQERGMIRVHQFNKVEMFCFTKPEDSTQIFDEMVASAQALVEGLGLHYRSTLLVTGDMSFASARTVDIEVWIPGQDRYYEVSSISNCTDYQARRSKIRFRRQGQKPEFVHTLNGSGLATSRLMVGLLENNQQADGSVTVPEVLRGYLGGIDTIEPQQ